MSTNRSGMFLRMALASLMLVSGGCSVITGRIRGITAEGAYRGVDFCCEMTHPQMCCAFNPLVLFYLPVWCWYEVEFPFVFVTDSVFYPLDIAWAWCWTDGPVKGWQDIAWEGKPCCCADPRRTIEYFCKDRFAEDRIAGAQREGRPISLEDVRLDEATRTLLIQEGLLAPCQVDLQDRAYLDVVCLALKAREILKRKTIEPVLIEGLAQEGTALANRAENLPMPDADKVRALHDKGGALKNRSSLAALSVYDRRVKEIRWVSGVVVDAARR